MDFGFASLRTAPFDEITVFSSMVTPRQRTWARSRAEDDRAPGLERLRPVLAGHLDDVLGLERAGAGKSVILFLAEEQLHALGHAVGHARCALTAAA